MDEEIEIGKGIVMMMSSSFTLHYLVSFNYGYFSTCLLSIFTQTLERKYMFLVCNAILAFLAKTSLIPSSSSKNDDDDVNMLVLPTVMALPQEQDTGENDKEEEVNCIEEEEAAAMVTQNEDAEDKDENEDKEKEKEEEERSSTTIMATDKEEVEEFEVGNTDIEELNRKFEEFIRKMKQEIRIEAKTHLITV
ncbi:hypothetical protein PIB30_018230 [Stylosanthes scabra]|uniref:Uncharacterized protein n=1 Tax=Stylosanthes scabra TaxID=79078 RepID=A0ABU6V607_9FABA|nr:hypothetical protein [Stylosanthes scabra]